MTWRHAEDQEVDAGGGDFVANRLDRVLHGSGRALVGVVDDACLSGGKVDGRCVDAGEPVQDLLDTADACGAGHACDGEGDLGGLMFGVLVCGHTGA